MPLIPPLVRVSKLDTQFYSNPEYTQHIQYVSVSALERRRVRKEERWRQVGRLGRGSFGGVWMEQCIQGDSEGKLRAVKKVRKLESKNYYRELEAIALFSHIKFEQCFVKSFGWYDNDDGIFIAMEYFPYGDLHNYLGSPLPESEGQNIVAQVLEGLNFMHQNGFAHRDLKPANILVVCKHPDWWVKIADFGISKRATEELIAPRTSTGTHDFAAPEVLGFTQSDSYTNAIDIWSLGLITFLILTGETLFTDQLRLNQYVIGSFTFPSGILLANEVSEEGCEFVKNLMALEPEDRLEAAECLQNPWLACLLELAAPEIQRIINISKPSETLSYYSYAESSASWSTHDQSLSHTPQRSTDLLVEKAELESFASLNPYDQSSAFKPESVFSPGSARAESTPEARTQVCAKVPATLEEGYLSGVWAVAFSPDNKLIASVSDDQTVRLWDSATRAAHATLDSHSSSVKTVAFSPDGKLIASAAGVVKVKLWDSDTGAVRATLNGHSSSVRAVVFSPDGKLIASAGDWTVMLWDSATGAARATLKHPDFVWAVAFSPDGKLIASGSEDRRVRLWDSTTRAACATCTLKGHSRRVRAVAFSPDGKLIASASDDWKVRLWDLATRAARATLDNHRGNVSAVVFSPDGNLIASASDDQTVRLWYSPTGAARATLKSHCKVSAVVFSPDGKLMASAGNRRVRLWNSATNVNNIPVVEQWE